MTALKPSSILARGKPERRASHLFNLISAGTLSVSKLSAQTGMLEQNVCDAVALLIKENRLRRGGLWSVLELICNGVSDIDEIADAVSLSQAAARACVRELISLGYLTDSFYKSISAETTLVVQTDKSSTSADGHVRRSKRPSEPTALMDGFPKAATTRKDHYFQALESFLIDKSPVTGEGIAAHLGLRRTEWASALNTLTARGSVIVISQPQPVRYLHRGSVPYAAARESIRHAVSSPLTKWELLGRAPPGDWDLWTAVLGKLVLQREVTATDDDGEAIYALKDGEASPRSETILALLAASPMDGMLIAYKLGLSPVTVARQLARMKLAGRLDSRISSLYGKMAELFFVPEKLPKPPAFRVPGGAPIEVPAPDAIELEAALKGVIRHPCSLAEAAEAVGAGSEEAAECLARLEREGSAISQQFGGTWMWAAADVPLDVIRAFSPEGYTRQAANHMRAGRNAPVVARRRTGRS